MWAVDAPDKSGERSTQVVNAVEFEMSDLEQIEFDFCTEFYRPVDVLKDLIR